MKWFLYLYSFILLFGCSTDNQSKKEVLGSWYSFDKKKGNYYELHFFSDNKLVIMNGDNIVYDDYKLEKDSILFYYMSSENESVSFHLDVFDDSIRIRNKFIQRNP